ncbi:MAG: hypothetical protein INR73_28730, partial [Williamsia sp.]|nr:hypothetical protein [Williamsia sp.]
MLGLFLMATQSRAQSCSGNLQPAFWKQTFGKGANPGPGLPPGKTNYTYTTDPCPPEGYYTIVHSTGGCGANNWNPLDVCCTPGDTNGYMMLVNASETAGDVYVDTARDLCGSTNFQLSFTVANLSKAASCGGHPLPPDLLFSVETPSGTVINSGRTGTLDFDFSSDIFSLYFRTPDAVTSVVVRIATANAGGCGNDFILDDIEIGACGPLVSAGMVVSPGNFNPYINRCVGDPSPLSLSASVGTGYMAPYYQWQFYNGLEWIDIGGAIAPDYSFTAPQATGTFKYRLSVAEAANISSHNCRVVSNEVTVSILQPTMLITAGSNSPVCEN